MVRISFKKLGFLFINALTITKSLASEADYQGVYNTIERYIEKIITQSTPEMPIWNKEKILSGSKAKWNYIDGCITTSLIEIYQQTKNQKYLDFCDYFLDYYVKEDGSILGYKPTDYNIDNISEGRVLFDMYNLTGKEKYRKAIDTVHSQVEKHPRTYEGNFWHKLIYPNQVWLDGLHMAMPFYARYEKILNNSQNFSDIVNQFKLVRQHMFDEEKKLYYHGYDASKSIFWADPETGLSQNFWLRSTGWLTIALIDVYDYMGEEAVEERAVIASMFKEMIDGLLLYLEPNMNMFWQVINYPNREGNYLETSGSAMISYSIMKGVRLNLLDESYRAIGLDIFHGICDTYLTEVNNDLNLGGICITAGLGPETNLVRDGTYEYYISEQIVENDAKGVGPLILAYTEILKIHEEEKENPTSPAVPIPTTSATTTSTVVPTNPSDYDDESDDELDMDDTVEGSDEEIDEVLETTEDSE